ncbi:MULTISPECIES: alpha-ketoglutarate-dependent dioxygenase AlkB family protein [Halomonas]|uniref:Alpha-ketoglutarate-dependent dioxygenase AlkB n=1 Tax=Halomonas halophila TaxID=29573 RepID=A0ABQ0TZV6_9GAMM|nr:MULTISPECIES: alpha-ketoglutarate-dependent dioxygenase AlkB [Halomonas]MDR5888329.1 alpha-ketoglutarate-dependent dioxygenase AlkB [Halomonas salina]WJY08839.1 alpha-ketoglutarate-dependent dioxygenase AlkB [Halomonas halophila]GEK71804.1 alpha-ketoglutarate-dependent dioxygenase AlkB [Halomonas halophila]
MDLFSPSADDGERLLERPPLHRFARLLGSDAADAALARLDAELDWQRPTLRLYGRDHPIPRRQVWMGDADYRYSGQHFAPTPWHPVALAIRDAAVARLARTGIETHFNSVLLNRYADGDERMGWHSDDEPELGEAPLIAAVSLGADRPLRFRWKDRRAPAFNVDQPHDSLLLMGPGTQADLEHALLPRRAHGLRISLTFRWVRDD